MQRTFPSMKKKKILVLPAGVFQIPLIQKAKESGHYVITADYCPKNPGHRISDEHYIVSTTNITQCTRLAKQLEIDAVVTCASDTTIPTVAYIAQQLGLSGISYDCAITLSDKGQFRKFQRDRGLPHPKFCVSDDIKDIKKFILECPGKKIIKPTDCSGSRGTFIFNENDKIGNYLIQMTH